MPPIEAIPLTMDVTFTPQSLPFAFPNWNVMTPQMIESGPQLQKPMMNRNTPAARLLTE